MKTTNWQKISIVAKVLCLIGIALTLEQLAAATFSYFIVTEISLFSGESDMALATIMVIATTIPMFMICGFFSLVLVAFSRMALGVKFENLLKPPEEKEASKWALVYLWCFVVAVEIALVTSEYLKTADAQARSVGVDPLFINILVIIWFLVLAKYFEYANKEVKKMKTRYAKKLKENHKPSSEQLHPTQAQAIHKQRNRKP
ncbi:MAG: hypothetical protein ABII22_06255 [Candidatus Micrarchaeota archaeon]